MAMKITKNNIATSPKDTVIPNWNADPFTDEVLIPVTMQNIPVEELDFSVIGSLDFTTRQPMYERLIIVTNEVDNTVRYGKLRCGLDTCSSQEDATRKLAARLDVIKKVGVYPQFTFAP